MPIFLGIDPGIADMGFGVISVEKGKEKCLACGSVKTPAGAPVGRRLATLHAELSRLIVEFKPTRVGIEKLYFQNNAKTAMVVAEARGVIRLAVAQHGLPLIEFNPADVKIAVTGYGLADKKQVQEMVKILLGLKSVPKPDDAADALAVAIAAAHTMVKPGWTAMVRS